MNLVERTIAFFSPGTAYRRQQWREATDIQRAYAGARDSRSRDEWIAHGTGANAEIGSSMVRLRNRASQLVRDNALAKRIVDLWELHLVGDGILVDFIDKDRISKRRRAGWLEWFETTACDADGRLNGYGLEALAVRLMVERGGAIIRKIHRSPLRYRKMKIPMQLQVLEPDFIDHTKDGPSDIAGNRIVQGIEFDDHGNVVFYWMWSEHPGESQSSPRVGVTSQRVPASDVIYLFRKERNQVHGVTWLHPVVTRLRDLDDYFEALAMKAKIEACFTVAIEMDGESPPPNVVAGSRDAGPTFDKLSPGAVLRLRKGETAKAFDPGNSSGHTMLASSLIRMIAIGVGLTYDQAYSDLTGANYSSLRAGKLEFNQSVSAYQWRVICPAIETVVDWFVEAGYSTGLWPDAEKAPPKFEITMPKTQFVDPKKDGDAEVQDMENGLSTWSDRVKARGYNPASHLENLKAEADELAKEGFEHPFLRKRVERDAQKAEDNKIKEAVKRCLEELQDEAA
jgi:lambda family phage portal protein